MPDDVAAYAEQAGTNTSGFIASVLGRRMRSDALRAGWAAAGYGVSDDDVDRVRRKIATLPAISDEQHAENLARLHGFDADNAA